MEPNIKIITSQRQKNQIIVDSKYIFNYVTTLKNNTNKFRYENYRHHNPRCPAM